MYLETWILDGYTPGQSVQYLAVFPERLPPINERLIRLTSDWLEPRIPRLAPQERVRADRSRHTALS